MHENDILKRGFGIILFVSLIMLIASLIGVFCEWVWLNYLKKRWGAFLQRPYTRPTGKSQVVLRQKKVRKSRSIKENNKVSSPLENMETGRPSFE